LCIDGEDNPWAPSVGLPHLRLAGIWCCRSVAFPLGFGNSPLTELMLMMSTCLFLLFSGDVFNEEWVRCTYVASHYEQIFFLEESNYIRIDQKFCCRIVVVMVNLLFSTV